MKVNLKKIIVSVLTIAIIASMGTIVPTFAAETDEMYFDTTYADTWDESLSAKVKDDLVVVDSTTATLSQLKIGTGFYLAKNHKPSEDVERYGYVFTNENQSLVISLPTVAEEQLISVGVRVTGPDASAGDYFDYSFCMDGDTYASADSKVSGSLGFLNSEKNQKVYNNAVLVPNDAKFLKITLKDEVQPENNINVSVFGFTFAYAPVGDYDTLVVKATTGEDVVNILSSGLLGDGSENWTVLTNNEGDKKTYGINLTNSKTAKLVALDGWKFTGFKANHGLATSKPNNRVVTVKIGTASAALGASEAGLRKTLECVYQTGHNVMNFTGPTSTTACFTDFEITMKKSELNTTVTGSVVNQDDVSVDVTISDIFESADSTMQLLVAGYEGDALAGVDIIPINKADEDALEVGFKNVTAHLPKSTTKVKAFLWKDLSTLVPVLPATNEHTVVAQ